MERNQSSASQSAVTLRIEDGVGHIRLNRPEVGNALDATSASELLRLAIHCAGSKDVRAVLLDGAGPNFCFGGDVKAFAAAGEDMDRTIRAIVTPFHSTIAVMARMSAPVVAMVRGVAAGGGLGLALAADFTLAGASASFKTAYAGIGLCGDGSVTYMLNRLVGLRKARQLLLRNRHLGAQEALDLGLIDEVHPDAELEEQARRLARSLADGPTLAFGASKNLLLDGASASLEQQLAAEADWMVALARSADSLGAVRAFAGKQAMQFRGR